MARYRPAFEDYWISAHALERFQTHHGAADKAQLRAVLLAGVEIDAPLAMQLTGRVRKTEDRYVVTPDAMGMFVLTLGYETQAPFVVTYLRFQAQQQAFARGFVIGQSPRGPEAQGPEPRKRASGLRTPLGLLHARAGQITQEALDFLPMGSRAYTFRHALTHCTILETDLESRRVRVRLPEDLDSVEFWLRVSPSGSWMVEVPE